MSTTPNPALAEIKLLLQSKLYNQADQALKDLLDQGDRSLPVLLMVAMRQQQTGAFDQLPHTLKAILAQEPDHKGALFGFIGALEHVSLGDEDVALVENGLLALLHRDPTALIALATLDLRLGRLDAMVHRIHELAPSVLAQEPIVQAVIAVGAQWHDSGYHAEALAVLEAASDQRPNHVALQTATGMRALDFGRYERAVAHLKRALEHATDNQTPLKLALAKALFRADDPDQALALLEHMISDQPDDAIAWQILGLAILNLGNKDLPPSLLDYMGRLPQDDGRYWFYRGVYLWCRGETKASIEHLERSLELDPQNALALGELAEIYAAIDDIDKAQTMAEQALAINPNLISALRRVGICLRDSLQQNEAMAFFERALAEDPHDLISQRAYLFSGNYADQLAPAALAQAHQAYGDMLAAQVRRPLNREASNPDKNLKIAFLSGDFRRHSVGYFLLPLYRGLKGLDDDCRPQIMSVNTERAKPEPFHEAFKEISDHWLDAHDTSDHDLITHLRDADIDVAVDLSGHTLGDRLTVLASRVAPVQLSYLGYPNTTGLVTIDGRITDPIADPEGLVDEWYREPLLRIDHGFLCYKPTLIGDELPPATAIDHPKIRFGCFNNLSKVTRHQAEIWAQILQQVPNSKLIFKTRGVNVPAVRKQLTDAFASAGLDTQGRLEMRGQTKGHQDHMTMYREIDIALDTFHYTGTTTTCEALIMGTPVLTKTGQHHASRVSASILTNIGRPDLITHDDASYVARAVALAEQVQDIRAGRDELRAQFQAAPISDEMLFAQKFMEQVQGVWRKNCTK
ncbi:MAG: tetratricopeptide repeat protein [Pseudomonadota bacterium]